MAESTDERDALVARGFWRSLVVLALIASAIVGFRLLRTPPAPPAGSDAPVTGPEPARTSTQPVRGVPFRDITTESGIDFVHESGARGGVLLPECLGSGVAIVDLDGDGLLDLVFAQGQPLEPSASTPASAAPSDPAIGQGGIRIYRQVVAAAGTVRFAPLADDRALAPDCYATGLAVGDVNGDARPDLYIAAVGQDRLLLNTTAAPGAIAFRRAEIPVEDEWGTSAGMVDLDFDGDLDIVVANYVRWSPEIDRAVGFTLDGRARAYGPPTGFAGAPLAVLENTAGTFRNVTADCGADVRNPVSGEHAAKALGLVFADIDRDGRTDILVANDKTPKFLLRNETDRTAGAPIRVRDIAVATGFAFDRDGNATGAMGIDVAWPLEGEELAIAVGNFANEPSSMYLAAPREGAQLALAMSDDALRLGIGGPTRRWLTFGALFADVDLDGHVDYLQANGHLEPEIARFQPSQTYRQRMQLFLNTGAREGPRFIEAPAADCGALSLPIVGRALAAGDLDRDGDPDLVVTDLGGRARVLLNDQSTGHAWLAVAEQPAVASRGAASTRTSDVSQAATEVEVTTTVDGGAVTQRRTLSATRSYLSQCDSEALFGVGRATRAHVRVRRTDGAWSDLGEFATNQRILIPPASRR
jgi:hypothetical protein